MKDRTKRKIFEFERQLNLKHKVRKIANVLHIEGQENFDISNLDADLVFIRPYNGHCMLPKGLPYPEAFKDGPVITWSFH